MRLVSYGNVGSERAAILDRQTAYDLKALMQVAGTDEATSDMRAFLERED